MSVLTEMRTARMYWAVCLCSKKQYNMFWEKVMHLKKMLDPQKTDKMRTNLGVIVSLTV